jgi:methionine aminopeptidase
MFFTIEPMVNLGRPETKVLSDGWTGRDARQVAVGRFFSEVAEHSWPSAM